MAKKSAPTEVEEGEVMASVIDPLIRDGNTFAEGDNVSLPLAEARSLRALGVVSFDDAAPRAEAKSPALAPPPEKPQTAPPSPPPDTSAL
jgi:hypothetical protein